jgi:hypothetical protein
MLGRRCARAAPRLGYGGQVARPRPKRASKGVWVRDDSAKSYDEFVTALLADIGESRFR